MTRERDIRSLLAKVRRIHIQSRKAVEEFAAGQYQSAFKGEGIEFKEVRDYQSGDEVRSIDWNVTARTGRLHVKTFAEERERHILLLVDGSASTAFGSMEDTKSDCVAELCALLTFAAISTNDRVGLILFSNRVESHIRPRKGMQHGLRILRELLAFRPEGRGTNLASALQYLLRTRRKRTVVFLVSDFLDEGFEDEIGPVAARHDLVALKVADPRERGLGGGGIIRLRDLETGKRVEVDLSRRAFKERFAQEARSRSEALRKTMTAHGVDLLEVEPGESLIRVLRSFFLKRMIRRSRR